LVVLSILVVLETITSGGARGVMAILQILIALYAAVDAWISLSNLRGKAIFFNSRMRPVDAPSGYGVAMAQVARFNIAAFTRDTLQIFLLLSINLDRQVEIMESINVRL